MEIGTMPEKQGGVMLNGSNFSEVPEGCIASIFAFTTPTDACRLALVSRVFRSAAESDILWERFLPSDWDLIVSGSEEGEALLDEFPTKKQLYMQLADRPLLIDGATKSFWLDKPTGSKCLRIAARSLSIIWSDTPRYWKWVSVPESRFPEVAQLISVCWLEIRGRVKTSILSPETTYAAYLVFKTTEDAYGLHIVSEASVSTAGGKTETQCVSLNQPETEELPPNRAPSRGLRGFNRLRFPPFADREGAKVDQYPKSRTDGWQELKIGEFITRQGEEEDVELSVLEVKTGNWKGGLIVEGIELRPAEAKQPVP